MEDSIKLNTAKLIFVGDAGAGKTSIIRKILDSPYDELIDATHGLSITDWNIQNNDDQIRVQVLDFSGQIIYHSLYKLFLSSHSLYVYVSDNRKESNFVIEDWINTINEFADNPPILIVNNKIDSYTHPININYLKGKYPNIVDSQSVSCRTGQGIEELKDTIVRIYSNLPLFNTQVPLSYHSVISILSRLENDFISFEEFERFCKLHNVLKPEELGHFLHSYGLIFWYADNEKLKDIVFLNLNWVITSFTKLLNSRLIMSNNGLFDYSEISDLKITEEPEMLHQIMKLMVYLKLCRQLDAQSFLIPDLLPANEPNFAFSFDKSLKFAYHYDISSKEVFFSFIVEVFKSFKEYKIWKSGIYIELSDTKAVVTSNIVKKEISVFVAGEDRFNLIEKIKKIFKRIHDSIVNVNITKKLQDFTQKESKVTLLNHVASEVIETNNANYKSLSQKKSDSSTENKQDESTGVSFDESTLSQYEWDFKNNLKYEWHHFFEKRNLLEDLNIRLSKIVDKKENITDGIILSYNENDVLIINDFLNKKVKFSFQGIDNLEMLAIVRYELDYIYTTITETETGTDFKELVLCQCPECQKASIPNTYEYHFLRKRKNKGYTSIVCSASAEDVSITKLLGLTNNKSENKDKDGKTTIINIGTSEQINFGDTENSGNKTKIDQLNNSGGQNTFADKIDTPKFENKGN